MKMKFRIFVTIQAIVVLVSLTALLVFYEIGRMNAGSEAWKESGNSNAGHTDAGGMDGGSAGKGAHGGSNGANDLDHNDGILRIVAVGDIHMGRGVKHWLDTNGRDYVYPFKKAVNLLKPGDIIFGNLEDSITASTHGLTGIDQGGKYVLKSDPEAFAGIEYAGFNLLNLANNHILDYYDRGLTDTLSLLDSHGISHTGAGMNMEAARKPVIMKKKGVKVGLLSYTDMAYVTYKGDPPLSFAAGTDKSGVAPLKLEYIGEDIAKLRSKVDLLIVSLHWGTEYEFYVDPWQVEFAHKVIDMGADMIIGHHPHRMKGVEIYKGKPIMYSLGNFISDQNDPHNQEGYVMELDYSGKKLTKFFGSPFKIAGKSQVVPVRATDAAWILNNEAQISQKLGAKCSIEDDKLVFDVDR